MLYVDDGAFVFTNRPDTALGCQIALDTMDQFGLTIHVGQNQTKPKSEAVFFPTRSTVRRWKCERKKSLIENKIKIKIFILPKGHVGRPRVTVTCTFP